MPDLNTESCDFPGASAVVCGMDIGCYVNDQSGPFNLLESGPPLLKGLIMTYTASVHQSQGIPCCHGSVSLSAPCEAQCVGSTGQPLPPCTVRETQRCARIGRSPASPCLATRPYRSLEDLHRAPSAQLASDPLSPPCWGERTRVALHCQTMSSWCELVAGRWSVSSQSRAYGNVPRFGSAMVGDLFPAVSDKALTEYTIKGLKEKLRFLSGKTGEASGPVRPLGGPNFGCSSLRPSPSAARALDGNTDRRRWLTSPTEIKEEAMRRLKLRRQNSTPNLAPMPRGEGSRELARSRTTEAVDGGEGSRCQKERGRIPAPVHIPSFEEFKRMRRKGSGEGEEEGGLGGSGSATGLSPNKSDPIPSQRVTPDECTQPPSCHALGNPHQEPTVSTSLATPVCTGPVPSSPLQTVALPLGCECRHQEEQNSAGETQSSCCPSLLLEAAADLSAYGVSLQQMKNGLIGSAIDLIKKSCTAESAAIEAAHHRQLGDITVNERSCQSGAVSTPTLDGSVPEPAAGPSQADCRSLCRRSSSDAAYGTTETAKAQRECRLRPHFSDPMPADAVKRKQLEMRIAAAAWGLGQKRHQGKESGAHPLSNPAGRGDRASRNSEPRGEHLQLASSNRPKHRWSSLSTDSGVVGLNDRSEEREEEEEEEVEGEERVRKSRPGEVERADSGIGPGTAKKWRSRVEETARSVQAWVTHRPCIDCGERDTSEPEPVCAGGRRRENLCGKCAKRRRERKEAILEFVNTESSYGEDLRIIREEFHQPMQAAGLLTTEQLAVVFSNIQELIEVNEKFLERLQDSTEQAFDQNDEDFLTVCIGEMFLEFVNMLPAFQTYCIHQSSSINLLNSLEKEKELLRIFLDVSQNDNTALRRMNLRSFLMAPLQRVTKYPLLLSRISSSTPEYHPDHCGLREAKSRVESHLEHINMKSRQEGTPLWPLRSFRRGSRRHREAADVEMREVAIRAVGWPREETRFAMEGTLQSSQPNDGQWAKKGSRSLKFQNLRALLMVNKGHQAEPEPSQGGPATDGSSREAAAAVRDAALVLMRDKSGVKFSLFRRPIHLGNCVVSSNPDCEDTFELLEIPKEVFVFRDVDKPRTRHWFRLIKRYSQDLGSWRKRRNALPNIMINTTYSRS
ncbi:uncharacterized protein arhgef49 [Narcine bancroftii]|uniref:uncharacterized protein arhgef49 n=1 Tax=Narcine bancroftii TaxID=1343680 RepID=UPI0038312373